jgi:hypothetical protein
MTISKSTFMEALEDIATEAWNQPEDYMTEWCGEEICDLIYDHKCREYIDDPQIASRINDLCPYLISNIIENELEETA